MTETRTIDRDSYRKIASRANKMHKHIDTLMNAIPHDPAVVLPAEWHELHELMSLAGIIAGQASRYAGQAPATDAPVPYTLAPAADPALYPAREQAPAAPYVPVDWAARAYDAELPF